MTPTQFYIAATILMALRLAAQWWARGPRATGPARGWASVLLWFLIYVLLLVGALVEIHRTGTVSTVGAAVLLLSLCLRFAGLHALRGRYHEAIVIQADHGVVQDGVYRFLRHPLHLALLGEMIGLALLWSRVWALPLIALALGVHVHRTLQEEQVLCDRLGADYGDYLAGSAWDPLDLLPLGRVRGRRE